MTIDLPILLGIITGIVLPGAGSYIHILVRTAKLEAKLEAKDEHLSRIESTLKEIREEIRQIR